MIVLFDINPKIELIEKDHPEEKTLLELEKEFEEIV
jgi:hypothetical protein